MNWRPLTLLPACLGSLGSAVAGRSIAADGPCSALAVVADTRVRARWPELPEQVREAFAARQDVDSCARVRLTMPAGSIGVEVVLPDGRSASRFVSRRQDVVATLQALLLLPADQRPATAPEPPPPPAPATPRAAPIKPAPTPVTVAAANQAPSVSAAAPAVGRLGIELSVLAGTRIGDGRAGAGLGVLTFLDAGGWLVGFAGRADFYQELQGGPAGGALVLGLLGGRRLRFGTLALDLTAGPAVALLGTTTSVTQQAGFPSSRITESTAMGTAPRLLAGARLTFRARSMIRTFVGVDAEAGSARVPVGPPHDVGRLPIWAVGLVLGATVGTP